MTPLLAPEQSAKPLTIKTAMKQADWILSGIAEEEARFIQFENKSDDKIHQYRFSINACKKLLGAITHSLEKLGKEARKSEETSQP